ncbi:hypothetical protein PAMP_004196 [Pampus punctatissimus]
MTRRREGGAACPRSAQCIQAVEDPDPTQDQDTAESTDTTRIIPKKKMVMQILPADFKKASKIHEVLEINSVKGAPEREVGRDIIDAKNLSEFMSQNNEAKQY